MVGNVSWILNKVVIAQVVKGNMTLMVYRSIWLAYVSQGVTITYLLLLAESISVDNMDRGDYFEGMPAALQSIAFCVPLCSLQMYRLQYTEL